MIVSVLLALALAVPSTPPDIFIDDCVGDETSAHLRIADLVEGSVVNVMPDGLVITEDGRYPIGVGDHRVTVYDASGIIQDTVFGSIPCFPPEPDGDIGEPLEVVRPHLPETSTDSRSGIASHVGAGFGSRYLALPEGPGRTVRICGPAACVTRTSTDAGPSLAMQRAGRVADLNIHDFRTVCGCSPSRGLVRVTVEYASLPPTDTE